MEGKIQQAYYGEFRGGHDLLATSAPQADFARDLKWLTDRPSAGTVAWVPYVSGFPWGEFYVVMRTFPAPARTGSRGGFVFTHAIFLPHSTASAAGDLRTVQSLLLDTIPTDVSAVLPTLKPPCPGPPPIFGPDQRVRAAARLLLNRVPGGRPVIWMGQDGFDALIARLWAGLWPEARLALSFRISLDPNDAERGSPTLLCTPLISRTRWTGFPVVDLKEVADTPTPAELLISGEPSVIRPHIAEFGVHTAAITAAHQVQIAVGLLGKLEELLPEDSRLLVRLLAAINNDPTVAQDAKFRAVGKLANHVAAADGEFVATLRNLDDSAFPDHLQPLASGVTQWTVTHLLSDPQRILNWVAETSAHDWWRSAVKKGLTQAIHHWAPGTAPALWAGLATGVPAARVVLTTIPTATGAASRLAELAHTCPHNLPADVANELARGARTLRAVELLAAATDAGHGLEVAVDVLLEPEWKDVAVEGLRVLAARRGPAALVALAVTRALEPLVSMVGELVAAEPSLRRGLDPRQAGWRKIWLHSVAAGAAPWDGIQNATQVRNALLDAILDGEAVDTVLLAHVARTERGDLGDFPRQAEVWAAPAFPAREVFLAITAAAWINRFAAAPETTPLPHEAVLAHLHQTAGRLFDADGVLSRNMRVAVEAFARIPGWQETHLLEWLKQQRPRISLLAMEDGLRLGDLVATQQWTRAARELFTLRRSSPSLRAAAQQCSSLLPVFDWLRLSLESSDVRDLDVNAWYDALFDFVLQNYQGGPDEERIWRRAGGNLSYLEGSSPRERWRSALHQLRTGRSGAASVTRLLEEMLHDLRGNSDLNVLYESYKRQT